MTYTLIGSQTSPFVRRIRILLENISYEFKELNIFDAQDALTLNTINPINQVPVLISGDLNIWDSRQIFNYLNLLHRFQNMDWDDENRLTAIDGLMTAGVALLLMKRSGINVEDDIMYVKRQRDRIESILDYLKPYIETEALTEWNIHSISLYCFLDWAVFRGILNLKERSECQKLLDVFAEKTIVKSTQIPKA